MIDKTNDLQQVAPEPGRLILVDTRRAGFSRYLVATYKDGEWVIPGSVTTKVLAMAKPGHRWAYLDTRQLRRRA
jgi:hypothetical protein